MQEYLLNALLLYVLFMLLAAVNSQFIFWLHWCFGTPRFDHEIGGATYTKGQIFSAFGRFVARGFNRYMLGKPNKINPYKALGVCIFCFGFHVSNLLCVLYLGAFWGIFGAFSWWFVPLVFIAVTPQALLLTNITYDKMYN